MKALKIVIIIFVVLLGIILVPPLFMPGELQVEKSNVLTASPEVIWDQVNCLENWEKWDVWHQDTNMVGHYEGPVCGEGAKNIWEYTNMEGGGTQTIIETREYEYIKTFLDFGEMGTADAEMWFEKTSEGTKVTWNFRSPSPYPIGRWISTLMIKPELENAYTTGLNNLEELTKNMKASPKYSTGLISETEVKQTYAVAIRSKVGMDEMSQAMGESFGKIMPAIKKNGAEMAGPPLAIWYEYDTDIFDFDCAIPIVNPMDVPDGLQLIKTYGGKVVMAEHRGDYTSTFYSWEKLEEYIKENNLEMNGAPWEQYITDPMNEPDPSKWITNLFWPVK
jgi:effector-binding domain-containing protein